MAAIYAVYTSPSHPPIPNHLPTLIVTPHENYLLTPSPQGDLCVAKLFPPRPREPGKASASDPGHSSPSASRVVRCEASRNLKWSIANTGVISPIYKLSLPSPDSPDLPLFQVSKPNPNAAFWSMFYFAYAGHNIPPKRIEFGKIQKNPPGPNGGGTRISITGKTPEEKAVWQTLGEGNEDCVEWVVLCAALNLLDDEIMKAAEKNPPPPSGPNPRSAPVSLRDPGPAGGAPPPPAGRPGPGPGPGPAPGQGPPPPGQQQRPPPPPNAGPGPGPRPPGPPGNYAPPPRGFPPGQGPPPAGYGPPGQGPPPPGAYGPPGGQGPPPPGFRPPPPGQGPPGGFGPPGQGPPPPAGYGPPGGPGPYGPPPPGMGPGPGGRPGPGPGPGGPPPPGAYGGRPPPPPNAIPPGQQGPPPQQIRRF
ncbi:hypothetical protein JR316_0003821 [Psilocybe cubensis]|uniref:Uncharacterized protein n=1 Tax=Psilocybe cubensis TaxID=181762 RepID=A0ACB8HB15_PSICU|nr:hypothetical protein JR316_0003821 [Psilocybe cubensis]KAH9484340.1 hypothetical protein JR316_0003821 [Psilocybe cubensis]